MTRARGENAAGFDGGAEAEAGAGRRQALVAVGAAVAGRPEVGPSDLRRREAQGVGDLAAVHLVEADQAGKIGRPAWSAERQPSGRRSFEPRSKSAPDVAFQVAGSARRRVARPAGSGRGRRPAGGPSSLDLALSAGGTGQGRSRLRRSISTLAGAVEPADDLNGMPSVALNSARRRSVGPMLWTQAVDFGWTGRASTRWFQALSAGRTRQAARRWAEPARAPQRPARPDAGGRRAPAAAVAVSARPSARSDRRAPAVSRFGRRDSTSEVT